MSDKDVLLKARELIDNGWTRHIYHRLVREQEGAGEPWVQRHKYCSLGAIRAALNGGEWTMMWDMIDGEQFFRLVSKVARFVPGLHDAEPFNTVAGFNDDVAKDKADVLAVFDQAIAAEED